MTQSNEMIPAYGFEVFKHAPGKEWVGRGPAPEEYGHYWHALGPDGKSAPVGPFDSGIDAFNDAIA